MHGRLEVIKLLYIFRGIIKGLLNHKHYNLFFDWFYPTYFPLIIEVTLNTFYEDDEVVHISIKLL